MASPTVRAGIVVLFLSAAVMIYSSTEPAYGFTSNWPIPLTAASTGHAASGTAPAAPLSVAAACVGVLTPQVTVSWAAATHATNYTIYQSTTSATGAYTAVATGVAASPWTSANLNTG